MREILFRGKRLYNGEWVYGALISDGGYYAILEKDQDNLDPRDRMDLNKDISYMKGYITKVIPKTVGQFTGFVDTNGKKIFEGDVIILIGDDEQDPVMVTYSDRGWDCKAAYIGPYWGHYLERVMSYEVVGNIHDNYDEKYFTEPRKE